LAVTRSLGDHCMKDFVICKPYCSELTIRLPADKDDSSCCSEEGESKESGESNSLPSFLILAWYENMDDQSSNVRLLVSFSHQLTLTISHFAPFKSNNE